MHKSDRNQNSNHIEIRIQCIRCSTFLLMFIRSPPQFVFSLLFFRCVVPRYASEAAASTGPCDRRCDGGGHRGVPTAIDAVQGLVRVAEGPRHNRKPIRFEIHVVNQNTCSSHVMKSYTCHAMKSDCTSESSYLNAHTHA
jgi:hypothetical protein